MEKTYFVDIILKGHPTYLSDKVLNSGMGTIINPIDKQKMLSFIKSNFGILSEREMARRLGIGKTSVNRWCRELGFVVKKHTVNEDFFKKWTPEMSYILGYIFADGNINWKPEKSYRALTITAAEKDKEHLEKVRLILNSTKELLYSKDTKSYRLIVNNKTICIDLMKLGLIPRKSLIIEFPEIQESFLRHFIRGVIDGDGSVRYNKRERSPYFEISIASGSETFLKTLAQKIKSIGIDGRVRKNKNNVFILRYSCSRGIKLAHWIYKNENLHLDRKFQEYKIASSKE